MTARAVDIPELVELIVDNLESPAKGYSLEDTWRRKQDLASAALVCRTWRSAARRPLFRNLEVTFVDMTRPTRPTRVELDTDRWSVGRVKTFAALQNLLQTSPAIAA